MKIRKIITVMIAVTVVLLGTLPVFAEDQSFTIEGTHKVKGAEDLKSMNVTLILTAKDDAPMPEGTENGTCKLTFPANRAFSFGEITVTKPGVYEYTVSRMIEPSRNLIQDDSIYHIHVAVFSDGMRTIVLEKEGTEAKPEKISYEDTYKPDPGDKTKGNVKTGDTNHLYSALAAFGTALIFFFILLRKKKD